MEEKSIRVRNVCNIVGILAIILCTALEDLDLRMTNVLFIQIKLFLSIIALISFFIKLKVEFKNNQKKGYSIFEILLSILCIVICLKDLIV